MGYPFLLLPLRSKSPHKGIDFRDQLPLLEATNNKCSSDVVFCYLIKLFVSNFVVLVSIALLLFAFKLSCEC